VRTCQQWQLFAKVATAGNKAADLYPLPVGQEGPMRQLPGRRRSLRPNTQETSTWA
jgi:hypothetical protein